MGQRTQLIIQNIQPIQEEDGTVVDKVFTNVYHNQWGYGLFMLRDIINYITNKNGYKCDKFASPKKTKPVTPTNCGGAFDITKEFEQELDLSQKITSVAGFKQYAEMCDNNNGWVLLRLVRSDYGAIKSGEYFFFKGYEECYNYDGDTQIEEPCSRVVSAREFIDASYCMDVLQWKKDEEGNPIRPEETNDYKCAKAYLSAFKALMRIYDIKPGRLAGGATINKPKEPEQPVINLTPLI